MMDEEEVAEIFNAHFTEKIDKLKTNIDKKYIEEPLARLNTKMANRNLTFSLKTVSEKTLQKAMVSTKRGAQE